MAELKMWAAGLVLILIGVSQAVFGWVGDSLAMRILYSAACLLFGSAILGLMWWATFAVTDDIVEERDDFANSDYRDMDQTGS